MNFDDTPQESRFRATVRRWLAENAEEYRTPPTPAWSETELVGRARAWQRRKAEAGFGAIRWPAREGGRDGTAMESLIFDEEQDRYAYPGGQNIRIGTNLAIPTIRKHGTPDQLERFAGPTLRGEILWCQLFSEPGAGSDLAALRTKAVRNGDHWVVNGQKVWSSWAHHADWAILIARTDPDVSKHKGLTFFTVKMDTAGIETRPIHQISGASEFNEVFLTDVIVTDSNRIGAVGDGWNCAMTTLMNERVSSGSDTEKLLRYLLDRAADSEQALAPLESSAVREKIARIHVKEQGRKYFRLRLLTQLSKGGGAGPEGAMSKLVYANTLQQGTALAMDLDGLCGLFTDFRPDQKRLFDDYLWSAAMRIAGGTDEILRNQLAERVLGMPGDIRVDKDIPFRDVKR